jgi:tetratricopeptide (TPR) repeat protein
MPALGMSISAGYGLLWVLQRFQQAGRTYAVLCCGVLAFCTLGLYTLLTLRQIPVWRTTESLMTNIIDKADQQSWSSFYTRARYRNETGRFDLALDDIGQALDLATKGGFVRRYTEIGIARAHVLYALGRYPEAFAVADWALKNSVGEVPEHYRTFWKELKRLNE